MLANSKGVLSSLVALIGHFFFFKNESGCEESLREEFRA